MQYVLSHTVGAAKSCAQYHKGGKHGKEGNWLHQIADSGRQGNSCSAGRSRFTKQFNAKTADKGDLIIPVVITVYSDRSFSFITKTPPAAVLLKKAAGLQKASGVPNKQKVGSVTKDQIKEIAELKMPDLNAASLEAAMSMIAGTARSMGITVTE